MNDIENVNPYPSTSALTKQGIAAVAYTAGGAFLLLLQGIAGLRIVGLLIGAAVCAVGIASLLSKDPADKKAGGLISAAGLLVVISKTGIPLLKAAAGTLLSIGAFGLLALGLINAVKFLRGLKRRS
jgi:hypothetical protein